MKTIKSEQIWRQTEWAFWWAVSQRIMSVDITEQGLLHIVIDSSGYKDMAAGFPIFQLDDMESSDKQLTYSDLHGYTRDYAKTQIFQVSPAIITEIEAEGDEKHRQYVVEFLKKFSDIILSSSDRKSVV